MTLQEAINTLDLPTWEWVGATILSAGITDEEKSDRLYADRCPVTLYLRGLGLTSAYVGSYYAYDEQDTCMQIPLPVAAVEFIRYYDAARRDK